jgi:hypothetical protein
LRCSLSASIDDKREVMADEAFLLSSLVRLRSFT